MTTKIISGVDYAAVEARMLTYLSTATDEQMISALGLSTSDPEQQRRGVERLKAFMRGEPR